MITREQLLAYPYPIKLYYSVFRDRYQAIHKSGVSYEELNAAALTGAAKAMLYWDPERCVFSTYAFHWIRQSIDRLDHVYDQAKRFKHGVAIVSANTKLKAGEDRELLDLLGTTDSHDHDLTELGFEIREALRKQVASPRYREMFTQYHGLETGVPMTLEEVANLHGLTRERVRQIISRTKQMIYPDLFGLHRKYILGNT